ncbi:MAG: hypothetical protein R3B93_12110 [Bacteroidia bacterium]|nr:hypothetical protein [Bacteroidota bacterium]
MDTFFLVEIGIVAVIVVLQFIVFFRNNIAISRLESIFPSSSLLKSKTVGLTEDSTSPILGDDTIDLIEENPRFSRTFGEIVETTNAYLTRNKGQADFDILQDLAEHKSYSQEDSIESNVALPLYIGLLCTFTGVILGLIRIAQTGVSDDAITAFIGGVLIGMIGSAVGLALTVRSNYVFKEARKVRDSKQYDYLTFLRENIIPTLSKSADSSVGALRDNLAHFNEGFAKYQTHMNESLGETLKLFHELKDVFTKIRQIERGLNGMGNFIKSNDGLIEKQIAYIDNYAKKAENFSRQLGNHIDVVDNQVNTLVNENIKALEKSTQAAYVKMDRYLSSIDGDTKSFAEALNKDLNTIRGDIGQLQEKSIQINAKLLDQLSKESRANQELNAQMLSMNKKLEDVLAQQGSSFTDSVGFKLFVFSGVGAFLMAIAGGVMYAINHFGA